MTAEESGVQQTPSQNIGRALKKNPELRDRLERLITECQAIGTILFEHSRKDLSAGGVLQHALRTVDACFARHAPMTFKVGWTHDPLWRWGNPLYGYCRSRECWEKMLVLHVSHEPHGPAMLEAFLIHEYGSHWEDLWESLCKCLM